MMGKICSKCNIEKELGEFYKTTRNISGVRESCISCIKDYNKNQNIKRKNKNYTKKHKYFYDENFFEKIYHGFYDDSILFLNRKKTIFDEVIETIKNKQKYRKK